MRVRGAIPLVVVLLATGCDSFFELIMPRATEESKLEERLAGNPGFDRAREKIDYYSEHGTHFSPPDLPVVENPDWPPELTKLHEDMNSAYQAGNLSMSISKAQAILERQPEDMWALTKLLLSYARQGRHGELEPEFKRKAQGPPPSAAYCTILGRLYMELGRPDEGLEWLDKARRLDPALPLLYHHYGRYYAVFAERKDLRAAIRSYEKEFENTKDPAALNNLIAIHKTQIGDPFEALRYFDMWREHYPLSGRRCRSYSETLLFAGEIDRGKAQLGKCIEAAAQNVPEYHDLGMLFLSAKLYDEARKHYEEGFKRFGTDLGTGLGYRMHGHIGEAYERLGQPEKAVQHLARSIALYPKIPATYAHYGMALMQLGRNEEALGAFDAALEIEPTAPTTIYLRYLIRQNPGKRFSKAEIDRVYYWTPEISRASRLAWAGSGYFNVEMYEEAEKRFREALELEPRNPDAWAGLIALYLKKSGVEAALEVCKQAEDAGADNHAYVLTSIGFVHRKAGNDASALIYYERALKLMPFYRQARINAARVLEDLGRQSEADEHWNMVRADLDIFDPLGPYRPFAYGAVVLLIGLFVAMRVKRARESKAKPGGDVTSARR